MSLKTFLLKVSSDYRLVGRYTEQVDSGNIHIKR